MCEVQSAPCVCAACLCVCSVDLFCEVVFVVPHHSPQTRQPPHTLPHHIHKRHSVDDWVSDTPRLYIGCSVTLTELHAFCCVSGHVFVHNILFHHCCLFTVHLGPVSLVFYPLLPAMQLSLRAGSWGYYVNR